MSLHNKLVTTRILLKGKIKKSGKHLTLTYKRTPLKFTYNEWVAYPLEEIFVNESYGQLQVKGRKVVDIGASVADSAIYFVTKGAKEVVGYEPDEERFATAQKNIALNHMKAKIKIKNGEYTVDKRDHSAIFKIDCEGCEYGLLEKLKTVLPREIMMEYHNGSDRIIKALEGKYKITLEEYDGDRGLLYARRKAT